jgi:hypothetical protein
LCWRQCGAFADEALQADREVVLAAVRQDGNSLKHAARPLRAEQEVVAATVQQCGSSLRYAAR